MHNIIGNNKSKVDDNDGNKMKKRISSRLGEHNLLPAEQQRCHSGSKRSKDQLLPSKAIFEDFKKRRKI